MIKLVDQTLHQLFGFGSLIPFIPVTLFVPESYFNSPIYKSWVSASKIQKLSWFMDPGVIVFGVKRHVFLHIIISTISFFQYIYSI